MSFVAVLLHVLPLFGSVCGFVISLFLPSFVV